MGEEGEERVSIYKLARSIKRRENTLYNALRSIYEDSVFVGEISELWPRLPLLANLRCGLWYSPRFHSTCYFKSTDGHANNLSFNTSRLNLHVPLLAGQKGGCIIVDSTRRGKRFPDSMSKTIPIWICVLNRAIHNYLNTTHENGALMDGEQDSYPDQCSETASHTSHDWDCSLHLPLWVSKTEKAYIEGRIDEWTKQLEASGADIASVALLIRKPLRPLWISQRTLIWLNEVPECDSWGFTPIILVSASLSTSIVQHRTSSAFSWNYISGAGDDEESWARGLSPNLFWKHSFDLINSGPELCNQKVADIVEKDRVYHAQRGQDAPQVSVKTSNMLVTTSHLAVEEQPLHLEYSNPNTNVYSLDEDHAVSWLGSTNLALGSARTVEAANVSNFDCILSCDRDLVPIFPSAAKSYLQLPTVSSKFDRFSLLSNLPAAVNFAKLNLNQGKNLLVCCDNGEDISVCVCLAIFTSLFRDDGTFDDGNSFSVTCTTKWEMRRRLLFICKYAVNARPSRGNLRQVFTFLSSGRVMSVSRQPYI